MLYSQMNFLNITTITRTMKKFNFSLHEEQKSLCSIFVNLFLPILLILISLNIKGQSCCEVPLSKTHQKKGEAIKHKAIKNQLNTTATNTTSLPFFEDFSSEVFPPNGFSIINFPEQWSISSSDNAGGQAHEAKFSYTNQLGTSRLVSPVFDLSSCNNLVLKFKHFYDHYTTGLDIGVATKTDNNNWVTIWQIAPTSNLGPETVSLSLPDFNDENAQFSIFISGNLYNVDYWFIDDIKLFERLNTDLDLASINLPFYINDNQELKGLVINQGFNTIESFAISWQIDDETIYTTDFENLALSTDENYLFTCNDLIQIPIGSYSLKVWLSNINGNTIDDNSNNDTIVQLIQKPSQTVPKKPLFESFFSSTCGPCASFENSFFNPFIEQNYDQLTLVKYAMNWPGTGDIYNIPDGNSRRFFYDVASVPMVFLNGQNATTSAGTITQLFEIEKEKNT